METDVRIREDVERELYYTAGVNSAGIGVAVDDGIVTLTGEVNSYHEKLEAVHAAERIQSVRAVACALEVRLPAMQERDDTDIARAVANILGWNECVPPDRIRVAVENGWVTLEGTVEWQFQKMAAAAAVAPVAGIRGITNLLAVNPTVHSENAKERIQAALRRCSTVDAANVLLEVQGDRVVLYGDVRSIPERDEIERIVWSAPGISDVADHLVVRGAPTESLTAP
jgi:osmotically-inducible protein OsmY